MSLSEKAARVVKDLAAAACHKDWHFELAAHYNDLGLEVTEYIRYAYDRRCYDPQPLHEGNIPVFLDFVRKKKPELFEQLQRAGFFSGPGDELQLLDFLTSAGLSRLGALPIDPSLLEILLAASQDTLGALEMYIATAVPLDALLSELVGLYVRSRDLLPEAAELMLAHILHSHDYYRSRQTLEQAMLLHLQKEAERLGLLSRTSGLSAAALAALKELGLDPFKSYSFAAIKKQYRAELKLHHPDRNPAGQEKTMALIQAYAILSIEYEESAT
ncbi:MAG: J domain-containing protein [Spirochaetales bacterium]|nr:J domain-containing protein [Spirochaetales bacterium]